MISLEEIAQKTSETESHVERSLKWLIKKNFFTDAYINYDEKSLVFKEAFEKAMVEKENEEIRKSQIEYISVVCSCCSGVTKVEKGKSGICEYCGAPLTWEPSSECSKWMYRFVS